MNTPKDTSFSSIKNDFQAGLVVFLVALPLCLGIALASGAPLLSGLLAGIVGGIVVSIFSGSEVSVSGPAAGLTVIVLAAISYLGDFQSFLVAVVLAGVLQICFSFFKLGGIANYVPIAVIEGMLAAIGLVIILKQIPHALGSDFDYNGDFSFTSITTEKNTFTEIASAFGTIEPGAVIITTLSFLILFFWSKSKLPIKSIPASLIVVISGIALNESFKIYLPAYYLSHNGDHLVNLPNLSFKENFTPPNFTSLFDYKVIQIAITIALVASLESLLSIEASDKLDPYKRISNPNKELFAQGLGNIVSGLIGGLPITSVVVRTSANINAGSKTWKSSFFHGILLLSSLVFIPDLFNRIPLSALAVILIAVGYKLCNPNYFERMYKLGHIQFIPFIITTSSILLTDLLTGVFIGLLVGLFFVLKSTHHAAFILVNQENLYLLRFNKEVTFLNKSELKSTLRKVPSNSSLIIDGIDALCIDHDIKDVLRDYKDMAQFNNIKLEIKHILL